MDSTKGILIMISKMETVLKLSIKNGHSKDSFSMDSETKEDCMSNIVDWLIMVNGN